jgi:Tfp pilus assembly protein PilN
MSINQRSRSIYIYSSVLIEIADDAQVTEDLEQQAPWPARAVQKRVAVVPEGVRRYT